MMVTMGQVYHIFMCKTRTTSVFSHGFFNNMIMNYGVLIELALILLIIYIPWSQPFFGTSSFPGLFWLCVFINWFCLTLRCEGVKWHARQPGNELTWVTRYLRW
eukprot:TRINITY_DN6382_c0_g1_i1.p1 TRINITY_DN6382_c0_g1~~TRINITY_DN6382_c0_g1_i1.p1  ORF type:complete len:104 (-),score=18.56 TRINITY_DN6382_c0_g1_i1:181-492(-)